MPRKLFFSCLLALLITQLAFGGELRKLGVNDLQLGEGNYTTPAPYNTVVPRISADNIPITYGTANDASTDGTPPFSVDDALSAWVDVRSYGAVPDAGASVDQLASFTAAIAVVNANKKALYVPEGTYYISNTLDTNPDNALRSFNMFSHSMDFSNTGRGAILRPHANFPIGTAAAPTYMMRIAYGRSVNIRNISFIDTYTDNTSRYIGAIGLYRYNSRTRLDGITVYDMYVGIHVGYSGLGGNDDMNDFNGLNITYTNYAILNSTTQSYNSRVSNSTLHGITAVFSNRAIGTGGGSWTFQNCGFVSGDPAGTGGRSGVFDTTAGYAKLFVRDFNWEPYNSTVMPYLIDTSGSSSSNTTPIVFDGGYVNLGNFDGTDNTTYPLIYISNRGASFRNIYFGANSSNIHINASSGFGRILFDTCEFYSNIAGKVFNLVNGSATFINSLWINEADGITTRLDDYGVMSKLWVNSRRLGYGDSTGGWTAGDTPANWDNGSIVFKNNGDTTRGLTHFGFYKEAGSWKNMFSIDHYMFLAPPVNNTVACTAPTFAYDATYFYVCYSDNTWKRIALDNTAW